jgi:hypothetical protein
MLVEIGMQWGSLVTDFLGKILILAGGPVLVAYAAIRVFAKSWLKHELDIRVASFQARQAEQLEAIKARNAEQLEQARHRLNTLFRQTSKLHEKEFEILANAWEKLNEALGLVSKLVSFSQESVDLDQMDRTRFEAFASESRLSDVDKQELLSADNGDRNAYYEERIFWYRLQEARTACRQLHKCVQGNSIFLEPGIRARFREIDNLMWGALSSREAGHKAKYDKSWIEAVRFLEQKITPLRAEIERSVQTRLGYGVEEW